MARFERRDATDRKSAVRQHKRTALFLSSTQRTCSRQLEEGRRTRAQSAIRTQCSKTQTLTPLE